MDQTAAHLADHVIPPVPVRQWVLSVPKRLRGFLADRPPAVAVLTKIFLTEIVRTLITVSGVTAAADTPSASCPRLGIWLVFYQEKVPDAFWAKGKRDRHRLLPFADTNGASPCHGGRRHARLGEQRVFRRCECPDHAPTAPSACLSSAPRTPAAILRPATLCSRTALRDSRPRRPRNQSPLRAAQTQSRQLGRTRPRPEVHAARGQKPRSHDTSRIAWAKLMARVGEEFPFACPGCGGDIRLIAFITDPGPIRKILTHLGEHLEPPPLSPARGPPTDWGELVQVHDDRDVFQATDRLFCP